MMVRVVTALLCAALALAPTVAFAAPSAATDLAMMDGDSGSMPCHEPCKGCADRDMALSCIASCMGLVAAVPAVLGEIGADAVGERVLAIARGPLVGTDRQPDTPPPKLFLA